MLKSFNIFKEQGDKMKKVTGFGKLFFLLFFMISTLTFTQAKADDTQLTAFIERLYQNIMGRAADQGGLDTWKNKLKNEGWTATQVAKFFYDSDEFKNLNVSDEEFLRKTYKTFFDREPDQGGFNYWLDQMKNSGKKRESIFYGFALSDEFKKVCEKYGVTPYNQEDGIKAFTVRFYNIILNRESDPGGLKFWVDQIKSGKAKGVDIVKFFFNSQEYLSQNHSNEEFIIAVYKTMFDREPDQGGLAYWKGLLDKGVSRNEIIEKMAAMPEFKEMEKKYLEIGEGNDGGDDGDSSKSGNRKDECFVQVVGETPNNFGRSRPTRNEMDSDGDGKVDIIQTYTYDANNCVTKSVTKIKKPNSDTFEDISEDIYTYENKLLTKEESYTIVNGIKTSISATYYEYYPDGREKTVKYDNFPVDGNYETVIYYSQDGSKEETDEGNDGTIDEETIYFFDANKKIVKDITTDFNQNMKEITIYIYDSKGNLIEQDVDESQAPGKEPDGQIDIKYFFKYDQYNNIIEMWSEAISPNEEEDPKVFMSYDYSNLIRTTTSEGYEIVTKTYFERY